MNIQSWAQTVNVMAVDQFRQRPKEKRVKIFIRKTSMGGYGVIDLAKLAGEKQAFHFFANHLSYPEQNPFQTQPVAEVFAPSHPAYVDVKQYWAMMHPISIDELQVNYANLFDF